MKDLIDKIFIFLPSYLMQFLEILSGPKKFINKINLNEDKAIEKSLLFLGITVFITFIAIAPLVPGKEKIYIKFIHYVTINIGLLFLTLIILRFSWLITGGSATFRTLLICTAYFIGPMVLILNAFVLLGDSLFWMIDPVTHKLLRQNPLSPELANSLDSPGFLFLHFFFITGWIVTIIWLFLAWGAYRQINGVSKLRSSIAFVIFNLISTPVSIISGIVVSYLLYANK